MQKKFYLLLVIAVIFFTDSSSTGNKYVVDINYIKKKAVRVTHNKVSDKVFITNFSCGGNISN
jgi:hypothetical protein